MSKGDRKDIDNIIGPPGERTREKYEKEAFNREHYEAMRRRDQERAKRSSQSSGGSCWIVTAYYGDSWHPDVCRIRELRDTFLTNPLLGDVVRYLNVLYLRFGRMKVGMAWRDSIQDQRSRFARPIAASMCRILLFLAKLRERSAA